MNDADVACVVVADHGLALLSVLIDLGPDCDYDLRDSVALMLCKWPLLCASTRRTLRDQPSYAPIVFYERTRLRLTNSHWFLDGLPACFPVFGAPTALEFPQSHMNQLIYDDVIGERLNTITKLEAMAYGSKKRRQLAESLDKLPDVDACVPQTVRIFVSRTRSMCAGIRGAKDAALFRQCANAHCHRFFYRGERADDVVGSSIVPFNQCVNEHGYWKACGEAPLYDVHRFCSSACQREWHRDWVRLIPDKEITYNMESALAIRGKEHGRVTSALNAALQRNTDVAHKIRKLRKRVKRKAFAVSTADVNRELSARLDMLNIDVGLLYAAATVARIPSSQRERLLPGSTAEWRHSAHNRYRNALSRVARLYRMYPESTPIGHRLDTPAYFRALKMEATTLF